MIGTIIAIAVILAAVLMVVSHFRARSRGKAGMLSCKCGGGAGSGCAGCVGCAAADTAAHIDALGDGDSAVPCAGGCSASRR